MFIQKDRQLKFKAYIAQTIEFLNTYLKKTKGTPSLIQRLKAQQPVTQPGVITSKVEKGNFQYAFGWTRTTF